MVAGSSIRNVKSCCVEQRQHARRIGADLVAHAWCRNGRRRGSAPDRATAWLRGSFSICADPFVLLAAGQVGAEIEKLAARRRRVLASRA